MLAPSGLPPTKPRIGPNGPKSPPNNPKSAPLTGFRGGPAGSQKYVIASLLFFRLGSVLGPVWGVSGAKTEPNSHPIRAQLAPKSLPEAFLSDINPNAHEIFKNLKFPSKKMIPPTPKCLPKGSQNDPKTTQHRLKNRLKKQSRFRTVLRPSWSDLGAILASSWGRFW